jgi:hypothetical protein
MLRAGNSSISCLRGVVTDIRAMTTWSGDTLDVWRAFPGRCSRTSHLSSTPGRTGVTVVLRVRQCQLSLLATPSLWKESASLFIPRLPRVLFLARLSSSRAHLVVHPVSRAASGRVPVPSQRHVHPSLVYNMVGQVRMSRKVICSDNAPTESFFRRLKTEWVDLISTGGIACK